MQRGIHRLVSGGIGAVAAPVIFLLCLGINYALVPWVCAGGRPMVLHAITLMAVLLIGFSTWLSWRDFRQTERPSPGADGGSDSRVRFTTLLGLLVSGLFFFVILAQWIPQFILSPCGK